MVEKIYIDKKKGLYKYKDIPEMVIRDVFSWAHNNEKNQLVVVSLTEYIDQTNAGKVQFNACTKIDNKETQSIFRNTKKAALNAYQKLIEAEFC